MSIAAAPSEIEFQRELGDARRRSRGDGAKGTCNGLMTYRIKAAEPSRTRRYELGVIPNVKQLGTELQNVTLVELRVLEHGEIPIVDARPVEEAPVRVAFLAER